MRFFKTDGDGIFTGTEACEIYERYGVRHIQSAPGDSASNDVAERTIRTFAELTRSNLLHASAPPNLWAEAMVMVAYVWNHIATTPNYPRLFPVARCDFGRHKSEVRSFYLPSFWNQMSFHVDNPEKGWA